MNIFTAIGQFFTNWGAKLASTFLEDDRYMMLVEGLGNTAVITLSHTHRAASMEEAFAVMTLFCALVGICGGAFFTICLEVKRRRK